MGDDKDALLLGGGGMFIEKDIQVVSIKHHGFQLKR